MPIPQKYRNFIDYLLDGYDPCPAAKMAGFAYEYGTELLKKLSKRVEFQELMSEMGLSDVELINKHKRLLGAKAVKWNVETKEWDSFDAGEIQIRALELAYKLKGKLKDQIEVDVNHKIKEIQSKADELATRIQGNSDTDDV